MGTEPLQPLTLICDYDESVFYIVSIDENELKKIEIPADIEWAMLIAYHRGKLEEIAGTELYAKYAVTQKACKSSNMSTGQQKSPHFQRGLSGSCKNNKCIKNQDFLYLLGHSF